VPGTVLGAGADGIRVQAGSGTVRLTELQRAGGKRLPAGDFLRGFALAPGQVFDAPATPKAAA
jgi:methionyl-tRNA formyltransferase